MRYLIQGTISDSISRRDFVATTASLAIGVAGGRIPAIAPAMRRLKVGHTGIAWGYAPENAEQAIHDVASLGYSAFESFGSVLAWWERRGGLNLVLQRAKLPLWSAYCPFELTDTTKGADNITNAKLWGRLIRECGGSVAVIGPNAVRRPGFDMKQQRAQIVSALNDVGRALENAGVIGALHPHMGSCVQTRDDVYAVMEAVDTRLVMLAPDIGELTAAGADPLPIIRDFRRVIRHAHLKDYDGGSHHDGYCPLGRGHVDIAGAVSLLEKLPSDIGLMVELNPANGAGGVAPLAAARESKEYLRTLGFSFTA